MEVLGLLVLLIPVGILIWFLTRSFEDFKDPKGMSDKDILSAIAGQADWLEKQLFHVAKFGGTEPHPDIAAKRRGYILRLSEELLSRHPEPKNLFYNATKRAAQLESEGVPREVALVQGVKQRLFADNGVNYMARWHLQTNSPDSSRGDA